MKILIYQQNAHHKNIGGFKLGCDILNYEYVITHNKSVFNQEWDFVWINGDYIYPNELPNTKKIMYGPQIGGFNENNWNKEKFPANCVFNSLSKWNGDVYKEITTLPCIIKELPIGVDIYKFKKKTVNTYKYDCFIYFKHRNPEHLEFICNICNKLNLDYIIIRYGSYDEERYLEILNSSKFGIWVGSHESQGFALQEALSTNTPLLVWDVKSMYDEYSGNYPSYTEYIGRYKLLATSIPYWSDECGLFFYDKEDAELCLKKMLDIYQTFHPRNYIINNLSPDICIKRMIDSI